MPRAPPTQSAAREALQRRASIQAAVGCSALLDGSVPTIFRALFAWLRNPEGWPHGVAGGRRSLRAVSFPREQARCLSATPATKPQCGTLDQSFGHRATGENVASPANLMKSGQRRFSVRLRRFTCNACQARTRTYAPPALALEGGSVQRPCRSPVREPTLAESAADAVGSARGASAPGQPPGRGHVQRLVGRLCAYDLPCAVCLASHA